MKMHPLQALMLLVFAMDLCSAKEEKSETKCPPKEYHLKPLKFKSPEDYNVWFGNWRVERCVHSSYCEPSSCMEYTFSKTDKGITVHGLGRNGSTPHGMFTFLETGGLGLGCSNHRAKGEFHLLALNERFYFIAGCFEDNSFGAWICTKGKKLDASDEVKLKGIAEENGFKWSDFKEVSKDCKSKKCGVK